MSDKPTGVASYLPGLALVFIIALFSRVADSFLKDNYKYLYDTFQLKYVIIAILVGMIIRNTIGVHEMFKPGVGLTRPSLKVGIVIMGSLYSLKELTEQGLMSLVLITSFVIGTAVLVLWLAGRMKVDSSIAGLMACGTGVCGVSAIIAAVPIVKAKGEEIAYAIGTILLFGVGCLFTFPIIGQALSMTDLQFGAWAGTGILNSGQVLGAAFAYSTEAGKVGGIFNIVRVLWLPVVVVLVALWYVRKESLDEKVPIKNILVTKFPIFVLGFLAIVTLRTVGVIGADPDVKSLMKNAKTATAALEGNLELVPAGTESRDGYYPDAAMTALTSMLADVEAMKAKKIASSKADKFASSTNESIAAIAAGGMDKEARDKLVVALSEKKLRGFITDDIYALDKLMLWFFALGFAGIGLNTSIHDMRRAGGKPFVLGSIAAGIKAVGSFIVVMLFL